ncbi:uncharacterized protein LOC101745494 isoform X1 [Bombyx mori]|uniref:uncharacterized protein LOC101745494 isoform X1 n=1 Tax=Bombyx mori TaxID=7091 RepID=UPI002ED566F8
MVLTRSEKMRSSRLDRPGNEAVSGSTSQDAQQRAVSAAPRSGVTQGPPPMAATSSQSTAPRSGVTQGPPPMAAPSSQVEKCPGVPRGSQAMPPSRQILPTQYSPASPTGPNSGVCRRVVRPPSTATPATTSGDAVTESVVSASQNRKESALTANPIVHGSHITDAAAKISTTEEGSTLRDGMAPPVRGSSRKSSQQSQRLLLMARLKEEHLRAKEEQARLQAELAAARISTLEAEALVEEEEDARTTLTEDENEQSQRIDTWLSQQRSIALHGVEERVMQPTHGSPATIEQPQLELPAPIEQLKLPAPAAAPIAAPVAPKSDIAELAAAIATAARQARPGPSHRYYGELPVYSGSHQEWLSFKVAYAESADSFSAAENTARLRRTLRGRAREAVENLLLHYTEPAEIMRTLESRFGRPEAIAATELERLRALPRCTDTPRDICVFANKVNNVVAALRALDRVHYMYNPELTNITSEKLPSTLRHRWFEFSATQPAGEPDLVKLSRFLQREADLCSPYAQPEPETRVENTSGRRKMVNTPQRTHTTQAKEERKCAACQKPGHIPQDCPEFKRAAVSERWDTAKRENLCFRCLRFRSRGHVCKKKKCGVDSCERTHHELLHKKPAWQKPKEKEEAVTSTWAARSATAYLKMAPITVIGPAGEADTWALLDDGSTISLIDEDFARQVGAKGPIEPLFITAIGDNKIDATRSRRVPLKLCGRTGEPQELNLRTVNGLKLTPQRLNIEVLASCHHLTDLRHHFKTSYASPKILIGQDNWHLLVTEEMRTGRRDQPVASRTPLGWVVHGAHPGGKRQRVNFVGHATTVDTNMDEALKHYVAIEGLTVAAKTPKNDPDERALKILRETTQQQPDGRYETALLWREEGLKMPNNFEAALNRLTSVEKKLEKDPNMKERYKQRTNALVAKGYAEVTPSTGTKKRTRYLKHFGVTHPMKQEKIRIVHDADAKNRGKKPKRHPAHRPGPAAVAARSDDALQAARRRRLRGHRGDIHTDRRPKRGPRRAPVLVEGEPFTRTYRIPDEIHRLRREKLTCNRHLREEPTAVPGRRRPEAPHVSGHQQVRPRRRVVLARGDARRGDEDLPSQRPSRNREANFDTASRATSRRDEQPHGRGRHGKTL